MRHSAGGVWHVDSAVDASGDGQTWAQAKKTIGEAMTGASANDEIWVAAGIYEEAITFKEGVALYGGFAGNEFGRGERNWYLHRTTIDGSTAGDGGAPAEHVVTITTDSTRLDGFTITGGEGNCGAGVYCAPPDISGAELDIANCLITGNYGYNAALYFDNQQHYGPYDYVVDNCVIAGNSGTQSIVSSQNVVDSTLLPQMIACIISGNYGSSGNIVENMELYHCVISGNECLVNVAELCNLYNTLVDSNQNSGSGENGSAHLYYPLAATDPQLIMQSLIANNSNFLGITLVNESRADEIDGSLFFNNELGAVRYSEFDFNTYQYIHSYYNTESEIESLAEFQNVIVSDPLFVHDGPDATTGTWTQAPLEDWSNYTLTLTDTNAAFVPGELSGELIFVDVSHPFQACVIDNGSTTMTVAGTPPTTYNNALLPAGIDVGQGDTYRLVDYRPRPGSPMVDAGAIAPGSYLFDIRAESRPVDLPGIGAIGDTYDLGPYEFQVDELPLIVWLDSTPAAVQTGLQTEPFDALTEAVGWVATGGTVRVQPGSYPGNFSISKTIRIEAPNGTVRIGQ